MKTIKKIWNWLVLSSANASKISLTVKGVLLGLLPTIVYFSGILGLHTSIDILNIVVNDISMVIVELGTLISVAATVIGLIRKIHATITGTNDVIMASKGGY